MTKIFQGLFKDDSGNKFSLIGHQDDKTGWWDYSLHLGWLPNGTAYLVKDHFKDLPLIGNQITVVETIQKLKNFDKVITIRDSIEAML